MILTFCNVFYKFLHVLIVVLHVLTWFTFSTFKNNSSIPDWPADVCFEMIYVFVFRSEARMVLRHANFILSSEHG